MSGELNVIDLIKKYRIVVMLIGGFLAIMSGLSIIVNHPILTITLAIGIGLCIYAYNLYKQD